MQNYLQNERSCFDSAQQTLWSWSILPSIESWFIALILVHPLISLILVQNNDVDLLNTPNHVM